MDFIEVYPNAITDDLCDRLIEQVNTHPGGYAGRTGSGVDPSKKISHDLMLDEHQDLRSLKNELLNQAFPKIADYFNQYALALIGAIAINVEDAAGNSVTLTPDNYQELGKPRLPDLVKNLYRSGTINLQKYQQGKGGYPHWHSEQFPQGDHNEPLHRVVLYMYYLNDVELGGETEFYYQQKKIAPRKGTMVIAPAGFTHSHRGNVPLSNDKYIATSWIMFHRSEKLYG